MVQYSQIYAICRTGSRFDFFFVFFVRVVGISIVASFPPRVMDFATSEGSISIFSTDISVSISVTFLMARVSSCTVNNLSIHTIKHWRCSKPAMCIVGSENITDMLWIKMHFFRKYSLHWLLLLLSSYAFTSHSWSARWWHHCLQSVV